MAGSASAASATGRRLAEAARAGGAEEGEWVRVTKQTRGMSAPGPGELAVEFLDLLVRADIAADDPIDGRGLKAAPDQRVDLRAGEEMGDTHATARPFEDLVKGSGLDLPAQAVASAVRAPQLAVEQGARFEHTRNFHQRLADHVRGVGIQ